MPAPHESESQARIRAVCAPLPGSVPGLVRRPLRVRAEDAGIGAFKLAMMRNPQVGAAEWQRRFDDGLMRVGHQVLRGDEPMQAGQRMETLWPDHVEPDVNAAVDVVYEDDALLILNKPAPLPVHASGRFTRNTLAHILELAFPEQTLRMAHRLDADTTGLVVFTKTQQDAARVQPLFENREVEKGYLLQVDGHPSWSQVSCTAAVGRRKLARGRRRSEAQVGPDARPARTTFTVLRRMPEGSALLEAQLLTGRTNQIRLHAAELKLPILGDHAYGPDAPNRGGLVSEPGSPGPALRLHAARLLFRHPRTGREVEFSCAPTWLEAAECVAEPVPTR